MKNKWMWVLGFTLAFIVLLALPFLLGLFLPNGGYGMMGYGYDWHMPMMYGGFGMMGFGMIFMWLIPLGIQVFIGLGIAWLVKMLTAAK